MGTAEQQVLKHILNTPTLINGVQPEIFTGTYNKIFDIAKRLDQKGYKPTQQLLTKYFERETLLEELTQLNEVYRAEDIDQPTYLYLKDELRLKARTILIQRFALVDQLDDKEWKRLQDRIFALNQVEEPQQLDKSVSIFDFKRHTQPVGITIGSGFSWLQGTGSDFKKGQLVFATAPSNGGKSSFLAHIVKHLFMTKCNVLVILFEETVEEYAVRIGKGILHMTDYQYNQLAQNEEALEREWNYKKSSMGELDVIAGHGINIEDLADIVRTEEESRGYKYDAIMIDYAKQIGIKNPSKNQREDQLIGTIFRQLKTYAIQESKLIVTAVQSNRGSYGTGRDVRAENIADSLGSIQNADFVFSIKRKEEGIIGVAKTEEQVSPRDIDNVYKLTIIKKRGGTAKQGDYFYYVQHRSGNVEEIQNSPADIDDMFNGSDPFQVG